MLVFWKERLVILSVPKTGTTALEGTLAPRASFVLRDPPILKHAPLYRYRRLVEPFLMKAGEVDLETLAVVRNPVDWLGSWFRYRHRDDLDGHPNSTKGITFDAFVEEYCKGKPAAYANVGSQAKFVSGHDKFKGVTHLFRYENQPLLLAFLAARFGTEITLPRLNVSPEMTVTLSPGVEAKLRRKHPAEFETWEAARA